MADSMLPCNSRPARCESPSVLHPTMNLFQNPCGVWLFLSAILVQLIVFGVGTKWNPFWYPLFAIHGLNIIVAPLLLQYSEEQATSIPLFKVWTQVVMKLVILHAVAGAMLCSTSDAFRAWLPFDDVSIYALWGYAMVSCLELRLCRAYHLVQVVV